MFPASSLSLPSCDVSHRLCLFEAACPLKREFCNTFNQQERQPLEHARLLVLSRHIRPNIQQSSAVIVSLFRLELFTLLWTFLFASPVMRSSSHYTAMPCARAISSNLRRPICFPAHVWIGR
ncbi:hypothetical protein BDV93DRAFT_529638 [Ceratobasidium sp. AG-I]|nr:hypothetical protein BDV93DRAFT_529638 [Ceratobasidium sp. AG-I]